ncbi:MAG TPA: zinc ribbon domain-containing protein [Caldisericia bacterium]|nr:zinc ribbon domain-containing protein [Caldisericia bacterium]HXK50947.1 zinc ribbon domain-containing protein [Caldisericia bacterium]
MSFNTGTWMNYLEFLIVAVAIVITLWIVFDSFRRYQNKWIIPCIVLGITFGPFLVKIFDSTRNTNWLLVSIFLWVVYLIIRPEFTQDEISTIETDQRLRDLTKKYYEYELSKAGNICPVCGLPIEKEYTICPNCFTKLRKECPHCKKLIEISWTVCPYCEHKERDINKHEN